MKTSRKFLAVILALLVVMSLSVTAFAQDVDVNTGAGSITIENATIDEEYSIYKIFDATLGANGAIVYKLPSDKTAENITGDTNASQWFTVSSNGEVTATDALNPGVLKSADFKTWAESFGMQVGSPTKATEETLSFNGILYGWYLVESSLGAVVSVDSANPNATVKDKNQTPSWDNGENNLGKVIIETETVPDPNGEEGDTITNEIKKQFNEANLNEDITFDIGINTTNFNGEKKIYDYVVIDELAPGMSYRVDGSHPFTVTVGGDPVPATDYTLEWLKADGTAASGSDQAQKFRITIPWTSDGTAAGNTLYHNAAELHIRYTGFLDPAKADKVDYTSTGNLNTANFFWRQGDEPANADPDHDGGEKQTTTYITKLELFKCTLNGNTETKLEGAEFTLTSTSNPVIYTQGTRFVADNENGTYWLLNDGTYTTTDPATPGVNASLYADTTDKYIKETFTEVQGTGQTETEIKAYVDDYGKLVFNGLAAGTYVLTESVVPAGYNKAPNYTIVVTFNETSEQFEITSTPTGVTWDDQIELKVLNQTGSELPSTGGIGTTIFYVLGSILLLGATVLFITKKRMDRDVA